MSETSENIFHGVAILLTGFLLVVCLGGLVRDAAAPKLPATPSALVQHIMPVDTQNNEIAGLAKQ